MEVIEKYRITTVNIGFLLISTLFVSIGLMHLFFERKKEKKEEVRISLTPEDVKNVKESWAKAEPHAALAADIFYEKLFRDEEVKALFPEDMTDQKERLMKVLSMVVGSIEDISTLIPKLQHLGKIHYEKKVKEKQYDWVGNCLLETLIDALTKEVMTDAVVDSWLKTYAILAQTMKGDLYK